MKIKYSTHESPLKTKAILKILDMIKDGEYRFGINGNLKSKEIWFLLNSLNSEKGLSGFRGNDVEFQKLVYFYIFGRFPKHSTAYSREWSCKLEPNILEKSKNLGFIKTSGSIWYETKITKDNVKEELDKLKAMYENKV